MIVIRHIEGRRAERVVWLLEELGVPYELDFIQGDVLGSMVALEKHHEMRMTPIVEDGAVVMVESSAILEYLLAKYGKGSSLRPDQNSPAFPAYLEFLHFAEGTAMQKIVTDMTTRRYEHLLKKAGVEPPRTPQVPGLAGSRTGAQRVLYYAENTLAKSPYFAGDTFTAADIMMHFPLRFGAPIAGGQQLNMAKMHSTEGAYFAEFPNVRGFLERVAERPAYQRAWQAAMPKGPPAF